MRRGGERAGRTGDKNTTTMLQQHESYPRHVTFLNVELRPDWSRLDCSLFETYRSQALPWCVPTAQPASSFTSVATYSSHLKVKVSSNRYDLHKPQHAPILFTQLLPLFSDKCNSVRINTSIKWPHLSQGA